MIHEKASNHTFTIVRFRDGDTLEGFLSCRCCGRASQECVRLLKIESWEPNGPDRAKALTTADRLTERYRGKAGALIPVNIRRDRYGRILADVIIGDTALALQLVESGDAWWGVGEPEPEILGFHDL